jgi:hypothetical protein
LRALIIFTIVFGNSLFISFSSMQELESLVVELAFDGERCLALPFCVEIYVPGVLFD